MQSSLMMRQALQKVHKNVQSWTKSLYDLLGCEISHANALMKVLNQEPLKPRSTAFSNLSLLLGFWDIIKSAILPIPEFCSCSFLWLDFPAAFTQPRAHLLAESVRSVISGAETTRGLLVSNGLSHKLSLSDQSLPLCSHHILRLFETSHPERGRKSNPNQNGQSAAQLIFDIISPSVSSPHSRYH